MDSIIRQLEDFYETIEADLIEDPRESHVRLSMIGGSNRGHQSQKQLTSPLLTNYNENKG